MTCLHFLKVQCESPKTFQLYLQNNKITFQNKGSEKREEVMWTVHTYARHTIYFKVLASLAQDVQMFSLAISSEAKL